MPSKRYEDVIDFKIEHFVKYETFHKAAVTKTDDTVLKLRIQDMPSELYEDVIDFIKEHFVKYEIYHTAAGIHKNLEALQERRDFYFDIMKDPSHHLTICCRDESDTVEEILGVSTMRYTTDDEDFNLDDLEFKTQEFEKYVSISKVHDPMYDIMKEKHVKTCYAGCGIAVHPDYSGLGIATEFYKARILTCKERGVPLTWAWMSALGSQRAAQRAGWHTAFQIPFADLERQFGVSFKGVAQHCKIMFYKVEEGSGFFTGKTK